MKAHEKAGGSVLSDLLTSLALSDARDRPQAVGFLAAAMFVPPQEIERR